MYDRKQRYATRDISERIAKERKHIYFYDKIYNFLSKSIYCNNIEIKSYIQLINFSRSKLFKSYRISNRDFFRAFLKR